MNGTTLNVLQEDINKKASYTGYVDDMIRFIEEYQLLDRDLWSRFVYQFKQEDADYEGGWKGEFWGKMMRGACFTYSYTKNPELYNVLEETVRDMMTAADENGRISTYKVSHELDAWDMWCRKYVLLGMQYFLEICQDETLAQEIIACMCAHTDAIMEKIGPGKKPITSATRNWRGLNSSSILEPIVRLYEVTKEEKYLEFASYIVECGGTSVFNIFEAAYEGKLYPYQYPVTKAYELTSCLEGLMEYYYVTGEEKYKTAIVNFADKLLESDFTVIGSSGCTHELLDHSTWTQANRPEDPLMQETCVTVTIMKFFYRLNLLTGDPKYVDAFERALYNAYFGSINLKKQIGMRLAAEYPQVIPEDLPFDSYSPLTVGIRGKGTGGLMEMSDHRHYGCCACIGSAGNGMISKLALVKKEAGLVCNLYIPGMTETTTPDGQPCGLEMITEYPKGGTVTVVLTLAQAENFHILLRNPGWSDTTTVAVNGERISATPGYIEIERTWQNQDRIEITFDMTVKALTPIAYGSDVVMNNVVWEYDYIVPTCSVQDEQAKDCVAIVRGPLTFAADTELGWDAEKPLPMMINEDGTVDAVIPEEAEAKVSFKHMAELQVPLCDGGTATLVDYGSAGKIWGPDKKIAAWIRRR